MTDETPSDDREERIDAAIAAYLEAADAGRPLRRDDFLSTYPDIADELELFLADNEQVGRMTRSLRTPVHHSHAKLEETLDLQVEPTKEEWVRPKHVGPYQLGRLLGEGGMARVYEGQDPQGRRVAVKLIAPQFADSPTTLERFRQEGELAGRINHPHCVFVYAADHEAGQPYIVMELMAGPTLKELVERRGPLDSVDAVAKIRDVIDGLEQAHKLGMIHRDVKPGNCYLDGDGKVKVGDFGLSRSLTRTHDITQSGTFVGTPLFASPEQLRGEKVDGRTDVYSVAATLYFLLTGQAPFAHVRGPALIAHVVSEPPPSTRSLRPEIPATLDQVVMRGLERQRERRYQTMAEFRDALSAAFPTGLTPAGLTLRLGAYAIDSALFQVVSQPLIALFFAERAERFLSFIFLEVAGILYFWLAEGHWGYALGKGLLRLRVTLPQGAGTVGLARGFVRSLLFALTSRAPVVLWLFCYVPEQDIVTWSAASVAGMAVGLAARFATARRRNGYRCLHDVLSGTRVVQLPAPSAEIIVAATEHAMASIGLPPVQLPHTLGDFVLRETVAECDGEWLVRADDVRLPRVTWLWVRPLDRSELPLARREATRPERLRWLERGEMDQWRWDAFVAPAGAPLRRVGERTSRLPWPALSRILACLASELRAAEANGTVPERLSVDQVFVQANGQAQLLDAWPGVPPEAKNCSPLAFLKDVVMAAGYVPERGRVRLVAPLAARRCLLRLLGQEEPYARLTDFCDELARCRQQPAVVTTALRVQQMAILAVTVGLILMLMLLWSRSAALGRVVTLDVMMVHTRVLHQVLGDDQMRARFAATLPAEEAVALENGWRDDLGHLERRLEKQAELRSVLAGRLGYVENLVLRELRKHFANGTTAYAIEAGPDPFAVRVRELSILPGPGMELRSAELSKLLASTRADEEVFSESRTMGVFVLVTVFLACFPTLCMLWAFVWPGGFSFRLSGLALVNTWGEPCGRLRSGCRSVLIWLPVVAVLTMLTAIDSFAPQWSTLALIVQGLYPALLVAYGVLPLRFPGRGPHDRLAGTFVVPR